MDKKISKLVAFWYHLIAGDHHKDKDCHFYITQKWSYNGKTEWVFEHNGYLLDDILFHFPTEKEAKEALIEFLANGIAETLTNYEARAANRNEWEKFNVLREEFQEITTAAA